MIVTIDGVAASGKSSVSSGVARALGIPYLSSGLLYRALTVLHLGSPETPLAALLDTQDARSIRLQPLATGNRVWLGEQDITAQLHQSQVDAGVSAVARHPQVRAWVDRTLRQIPAPFVAEGRDMGSTVFPSALAKFYLTASPRVRALRRAPERGGVVDEAHLAQIEAALRARDELDQQQIAPATDAQIIHTDNLTLEQVIGKILGAIEAKRDHVGAVAPERLL